MTYNKRVTLGREDLDAVNREGLSIHGICLDDGHCVVIDTEGVVRVAGDRNQAEPIPAKDQDRNVETRFRYLPLALDDVDHRQCSGGSRRASA